MSRLFKRAVSVTIARMFSGEFFRPLPNAIVVEDLRVAFSIEKNLGPEPNTCEVRISNLSEETRAETQRKPLHVRLDAGYDGQIERLFTGDLRWAQSTLERVTWVTRMQIADGDRAYRNARTNFSFSSGVTTKTVLKHLASGMGLEIPKSLDDAKEMASRFINGTTIQGPSHRELSRLLNRHNMGWSIQDGRLQVLREGEATTAEAQVISQENGMVGVPEYGAPKNPGEPPVLTARVLLHPGLIPGGTIRLEANETSGLFRLDSVKHSGDTHGQEWFTDVEATPI